MKVCQAAAFLSELGIGTPRGVSGNGNTVSFQYRCFDLLIRQQLFESETC